jgi:hypothetical protein
MNHLPLSNAGKAKELGIILTILINNSYNTNKILNVSRKITNRMKVSQHSVTQS